MYPVSALCGRVTLLFPREANPQRMASTKLPFQGLGWEMLGSQCPYDQARQGGRDPVVTVLFSSFLARALGTVTS